MNARRLDGGSRKRGKARAEGAVIQFGGAGGLKAS